jgi:lipopolysaccharide transport system permease protein
MDQIESMPKIVYSPVSNMRKPGLILRQMWHDLVDSRELAGRLFVRDISAQYRQSLLGVFWAFLPPLVTGLVFIFLQARRVVNVGETDIPYPVFVLVGTTMWQLFTDSISAPLKSITTSRPILAKIKFPYEALIISSFYHVLFGLAIKMIVLIGVFLFFQVPLTWGQLLAPFGMFMLVLLGLTMGMLLMPIGMLYSDVSTSLPTILQIMFFLTPVVYPPPQSFPYSLIASLNPVSPLLVATRDLLTKGVLANPLPFLVISAFTFVFFFIAWLIYRVSLPILIERMEA